MFYSKKVKFIELPFIILEEPKIFFVKINFWFLRVVNGNQ